MGGGDVITGRDGQSRSPFISVSLCVYVCAHMSEFLSSACHFLGLNRAGSGVTGRKEQHLHGGLFTHTPESRTHMCVCVFTELAAIPSALLPCFCWLFVS